jgi:hypothetical protein
MRILVIPSALVWVLLAFRSDASAECIRVTPDLPKFFQDADLVFRGTLLGAELRPKGSSMQALTFSVDNVWKGEVTRQFTVYQFLFVESYAFERGAAYVLFAHLLTPEERQRRRIPADADQIFEVETCGGPPWQPGFTELNNLARPRRPRP